VARNIVICLDGTRNEPDRGATNVMRLFRVAAKSDEQLVYYDPGVGTMGARGAVTRAGKNLTMLSGLVMGHGVHDNIAEAYHFLMNVFQPGDRVFAFGFSRGAYTVRALAGMLRTVGLLRPGTENLVPYALKLYAQGGKAGATDEEEARFWKKRGDFADNFSNPDFPSRFAKQIHFLGVWDTVKSVGWLNWRAQFQQARWPFTRKLPNVRHGRHALALDERRRFYGAYRFDPNGAGGDLRETWFVGVHSDVGGGFEIDPPNLADISLDWMIKEAHAKGLLVDEAAYKKVLKVSFGQPLAPDTCLGDIHHNGVAWAVLGLGWRRRTPREGDALHPSVEERIDRTRDGPAPYRILGRE
jgi:uncharacterized protein (DUF2235 family)